MTWQDTEDIAIALAERYPDTDPLTVRFTDLHRWVIELPGFADDPKASNEKASSRRSRWRGSRSSGPYARIERRGRRAGRATR